MPAFKISVVIPTYNRRDKVMRAVESVLNQSTSPFEILVIDDGSTDGTDELFHNLDPRVRYVPKPNGGVSSARNHGIRQATGDWLAFLDSDDWWQPDMIEKQTAALSGTGADICFTGVITDDGERYDPVLEIEPSLEEDAIRFFKDPLPFFHRSEKHPHIASMMIRRDLLQSTGSFDETLRVAEDTHLFYRLALKNGFAYVNSLLYNISRNEGGGLSRDIRPETALERYRCYIRVQSELYLNLVSRDQTAARHVKGRIAFFALRCSEICCAMGDNFATREFALIGLTHGTINRHSVKSAILLAAPFLLKSRLEKKWGFDGSLQTDGSDH